MTKTEAEDHIRKYLGHDEEAMDICLADFRTMCKSEEKHACGELEDYLPVAVKELRDWGYE